MARVSTTLHIATTRRWGITWTWFSSSLCIIDWIDFLYRLNDISSISVSLPHTRRGLAAACRYLRPNSTPMQWKDRFYYKIQQYRWKHRKDSRVYPNAYFISDSVICPGVHSTQYCPYGSSTVYISLFIFRIRNIPCHILSLWIFYCTYILSSLIHKCLNNLSNWVLSW